MRVVRNKLTTFLVYLMVVFSFFVSVPPTLVSAAVCADSMSKLDCEAIMMEWTPWKPDNATGCGSSFNGSLTGKDNATKIWNYFRFSRGLNDILTAAIMGNIQQESTFNPILVEGMTENKDPTAVGGLGWGLVQWTPGAKVLIAQKNADAAGPIYELAVQLEIIWWEMNNTAPTGKQNILEGMKLYSNDLAKATEYFRANYESGYEGSRQQYARDALDDYGGGTTPNVSNGSPASPSNSCGGNGSSLPPDCKSISGNARILCAAQAYDPVSYEMSGRAGHQGAKVWHESCPTIGPSCVLDCSGLVNIALYDVFGVDQGGSTFTMLADAAGAQKLWKEVPAGQMQAGDMLLPHNGHVEIIDHVAQDGIHTFGAHTANKPQPQQVGPSVWNKSNAWKILRYVGEGAS